MHLIKEIGEGANGKVSLYQDEKTEEFLLGARADKSIKNKNGKTAKEFGKYVY